MANKDFYNFNNDSLPIDKYSGVVTGNNYICILHLLSEKPETWGEPIYAVIPQWPEQIADSLSSSFGQTNALSRSAPVFSYKNSGPREVQISLDLHRDMMDEANYCISNLPIEDKDDYVDALVKALQAVALPNYHDESSEVVVPMVAVRFGDQLFIKGVVDGGVTVTYSGLLLSNNKYSKINISFKVYEIDPMDARSIAQVGSFRNISKSYNDIVGG
jgi:hypothetical protein